MTNYTQLEEELNCIKYKEVGVGSLLALEFFLCHKKMYKRKRLKGYLIFIRIILKAFLSKTPIFKNKNILYYKSGDKNHHNQIYSPFHDMKDAVILVGGAKEAIINSSVFNLNIKSFIYIVKWVFSNYQKFKIIVNKNSINNNELSLFIDLIINLLRLNFWDSFFKKNKVEILIGDYDRGNASVPIFLMSKKYKTPSIVIQHGVINPPYGYTPLIANTVFVWGAMQKMQYKALGVAEHRINVTGTSIVTKISRSTIVKYQEKKNIVLAVNPIKKEYIKQQIEVFSQLNLKGIYNLYIKIHPSQTIQSIEELLDDKSIIILSNNIKFTKFVEMCYVLVTHNSGLANECILNDVPVIILDNLPIAAGNGLELHKHCNVPLVNNIEQLNRKIININNDLIDRSSLYYKTGIEAKENILKEVLNIIN